MSRAAGLPLGWLLLLLLALARCAPVNGSRSEAALPAWIHLADADGEVRLVPGDAAFAPVVQELNCVIAGLDTPLYAYYPPERVQDELMVQPYLEALYSPQVTLRGEGYSALAGQLIVALTPEGPLTLIRATEDSDWTANESSDADCIDSLFQAVRDGTGIDLAAKKD